MEFLKRNWAQTRAYLGELSASQKWLIAAMLVILLMVGGLLTLYAGGAQRVPISQFSGSRSDQVLARLRAAGIDAAMDGGRVTVPSDQQSNAIVLLAQDDLLSEDASQAFNDMVASPWETNAQGRRKFLIAKQEVLGSIISKMKGVRSAEVIISMPEDQGFGRTFDRPTASATLSMSGNRHMDQHLVQAVAGLVAGAVAEMPAKNVTVIDANLGRSFTVNDPQAMAATEQAQRLRQEEDRQRTKIDQYLAIPGSIVAVHIRQDPLEKEVRDETTYMDSEPLQSTSDERIDRRNITKGGEPGARSNTGSSIAGGGQEGTVEKITRSEQRFGEKKPTVRSRKTIMGHTPQQINVTINVPRHYFVQVYKARHPKATGDPDQAALKPVVQQQLADIQSKVQPLIDTGKSKGVVKASMFFDRSFLQPQVAGNGSGGVLVDSRWVKPATIAGLCVLALGLMVMMVRKATREETLPSVEELAGVPPTAPAEEEQMYGEADDTDTAMAGVELDEEQLRSRRVAEQISEMIKASPQEAGSLLGKWVQVDE